MVRLYLILCAATLLLVSLPAICGFDDALMAAGRHHAAALNARPGR